MSAEGNAVALAARGEGRVRRASLPRLSVWTTAAAIAGIVAVAAILRFADLGSNPGGLYSDESWEAVGASRILHDPGFRPVWFVEGGGREALYAYLVAGAFAFAGETVSALRATSALLGVAGVLAIWSFARRYGRGVALAAAAWAAGSLWLVDVSRLGMRNVLVPLFGALALAALLRWRDAPSRRSAALAGGTLALAALYTYQPLKLLPVLAVLWLLWLRHAGDPAYLRLRASLGVAVLAFLIVGAPMLAVAATNPTNYFGRVAAVTSLNPGVQAEVDPLTHALRTIAMPVLVGDPNPRHDVGALPLLGPPVLAWPLLGIAAAGIWRLWRRRSDAAHALILIALPVFALAPLLAVEGGSPHFLRALGLAAPLAVVVGLGVAEVGERLGAWFGRGAWFARAGARPALRARLGAAVAFAGCGALLAVSALASGVLYLSRPVADRYDAFSFAVVAEASQAAARPGSAVIADPDEATTIRFLDAGHVPGIAAPGARIPAGGYVAVFARSKELLVAALGPDAAAWATVAATDPGGAPTVWMVESR